MRSQQSGAGGRGDVPRVFSIAGNPFNMFFQNSGTIPGIQQYLPPVFEERVGLRSMRNFPRDNGTACRHGFHDTSWVGLKQAGEINDGAPRFQARQPVRKNGLPQAPPSLHILCECGQIRPPSSPHPLLHLLMEAVEQPWILGVCLRRRRMNQHILQVWNRQPRFPFSIQFSIKCGFAARRTLDG